MKKVIFAFILIFAGYHVNAQSLFQPKPLDSLSTRLFDNYLKGKPRVGKYDKYLKTKADTGMLLLQFGNHRPVLPYNCDNMPIAKLTGFDKMPIAKLGGYYTMPIKRIEDRYELQMEKRLFPLPPTKPDSTLQPGRLKLLNSF